MYENFGSGAGESAVTLPPSPDLRSQTLRVLAILRAATPVGQALMILLAVQVLDIWLPLVPVTVLLAIEAGVALLTWKRLRTARPVSDFELFLQVHLDIVLLTAMLYFTGGTENPFAPLFLLPVAIAASSLERRWVWVTALSTVCAYVALRYFHVHLIHRGGETQLHELHAIGMVVNYAFTAGLLAFFLGKIRVELQRHTRMLAAVHEKQMRSDSLLAMGALAAGCAHELSSPLGTMAVVVTELQRERAGDTKLQDNLRLLNQQIQVSKQVISNLTGAAGQRRAEAAGVARLDQFLHHIVEQAKAVHPGASIHARIGNGEAAPTIVAEETLRQAFSNLIENAVRASPCDVHVLAEWSGDDFVFAVCDRGPGFPQEVLGKLGNATATIGGLDRGRGPGLLLTNVTLGRLGGSLTLKNKSQGGARVEARLPLRAILC